MGINKEIVGILSEDFRGESDLEQNGFTEITDIGLLLQRIPLELMESVVKDFISKREMKWGFRVFVSPDQKLLVTVPLKDKWTPSFEDMQIKGFSLEKPLNL
jgi:hypothetical protein